MNGRGQHLKVGRRTVLNSTVMSRLLEVQPAPGAGISVGWVGQSDLLAAEAFDKAFGAVAYQLCRARGLRSLSRRANYRFFQLLGEPCPRQGRLPEDGSNSTFFLQGGIWHFLSRP